MHKWIKSFTVFTHGKISHNKVMVFLKKLIIFITIIIIYYCILNKSEMCVQSLPSRVNCNSLRSSSDFCCCLSTCSASPTGVHIHIIIWSTYMTLYTCTRTFAGVNPDILKREGRNPHFKKGKAQSAVHGWKWYRFDYSKLQIVIFFL